MLEAITIIITPEGQLVGLGACVGMVLSSLLEWRRNRRRTKALLDTLHNFAGTTTKVAPCPSACCTCGAKPSQS